MEPTKSINLMFIVIYYLQAFDFFDEYLTDSKLIRKYLILLLFAEYLEAHLEPSQTSEMELFAKIVDDFNI